MNDAHIDVLIFGVDVDGPHISVDLYGGSRCLIGSVSYDIGNPEHRRQALAILRQWRKEDSPVVYMCDEQGIGRLLDMDTYSRICGAE